MKVKIKIAELAGQHGFKNAYALQNALQCSPTMASRLWKGNFKQIGIETIESLCELLKCSPNDLFGFDVESVKADKPRKKHKTFIEGITPLHELLNRDKKDSGNTFNNSVLDIVKNTSDNELLSTVEAAERLNVSRRSVGDYIKDGKLKAVKGKQNHNFILESDLIAFMSKNNSGEK